MILLNRQHTSYAICQPSHPRWSCIADSYRHDDWAILGFLMRVAFSDGVCLDSLLFFYPSLTSTFWVFLTTELNRLARVGRNLTNTVINIHILPLTPVQRVETRHQLVFRELTLSLIHNFLFSSDDSPEELYYVAVVGRQALSFQAMETSSDHMDQRRR